MGVWKYHVFKVIQSDLGHGWDRHQRFGQCKNFRDLFNSRGHMGPVPRRLRRFDFADAFYHRPIAIAARGHAIIRSEIGAIHRAIPL
jgi:hypothetical protein